jgi:hypothetical protein
MLSPGPIDKFSMALFIKLLRALNATHDNQRENADNQKRRAES